MSGRVITAVLGAVVATLLHGAIVAAAPGGSTLGATQEEPPFVAQPGPGPEGRSGYFVFDADPGAVIRSSVAVRNDLRRPLRLQIDPIDAATAVYGGVSYGLPDDPIEKVGSWVTISTQRVILEPGVSRLVPFSVRVPADAASGVHLGGISVAAVAPEENGRRSPRADEAGASVVVRTRRVIAVQVELPGDDEPRLEIAGVTATARPDGIYLEIDVANDGHGLTRGRGQIQVEDFERDFDIDTFVPGTSIGYPVKWRRSAADGEYPGRVEIRYDEDKIATWEGVITVGEALQRELVDRGVDPTDDDGFSLGPLLPAAIGLLVGLGAAWLLFGRRRRDDSETTRASDAPN